MLSSARSPSQQHQQQQQPESCDRPCLSTGVSPWFPSDAIVQSPPPQTHVTSLCLPEADVMTSRGGGGVTEAQSSPGYDPLLSAFALDVNPAPPSSAVPPRPHSTETGLHEPPQSSASVAGPSSWLCAAQYPTTTATTTLPLIAAAAGSVSQLIAVGVPSAPSLSGVFVDGPLSTGVLQHQPSSFHVCSAAATSNFPTLLATTTHFPLLVKPV